MISPESREKLRAEVSRLHEENRVLREQLEFWKRAHTAIWHRWLEHRGHIDVHALQREYEPSRAPTKILVQPGLIDPDVARAVVASAYPADLERCPSGSCDRITKGEAGCNGVDRRCLRGL